MAVLDQEGKAPSATSISSASFGRVPTTRLRRRAATSELSVFAGGKPARDALRAFDKGGKAGSMRSMQEDRKDLSRLYGKPHAAADVHGVAARDMDRRRLFSPAPGDVCRAGPLLSRAFAKRDVFSPANTTCPAF